MAKRRVSVRENKLIDLLIDLPEAELDMLIRLCSRIITTATDGKRIKLEQLQERYADDLSN